MEYFDELLKNKYFDVDKLVGYGFLRSDNKLEYRTEFFDSRFTLVLTYSSDRLNIDVLDNDSDDKFAPIYVKNSEGAFLGDMRKAIKTILDDIISRCGERRVFANRQSEAIIEYARKKYRNELEFLWKNDYAVLRRSDTQKWYAVLMPVKSEVLGLTSNSMIEIIDLRVRPEEIKRIIDNKKYYSAYHIDKNHWCSVIMDDSVSDDELKRRLDESFDLAD